MPIVKMKPTPNVAPHISSSTGGPPTAVYSAEGQSICGWCNLHNAGCIMQVAGHVLWPRAAWLYHGATFLMTLSFLVSGGFVSKLNN